MARSIFKSKLSLFAIVIATIFSSCKKDSKMEADLISAGPNLNFYALTDDNKLLLLNANNSSTITSQVSLTGLQNGEAILSIDFRPATGQLYGVGSSSRIYIIDPKSGVSRAISAAPFTPALSGSVAGFDFNPTVDRIRLVTSTNQNLRLNPENGAVATADLNINAVSNAVVNSVAYTQNRAGASTTLLFDIDIANNKLHKQDPPNDGKLVEIGSLGVDAEEAGGFDINPDGTVALAALSVSGKSGLFTLDLNSGKATKVGNFMNRIIGIAIPTEPVAYALNTSNELVIFNPSATSITPINKPITGIQSGETLIGLDMRPANGQLYALGSSSRLYTINASSGAAALVGTGALSTLITGSDVGFDFNPLVDRIRIVSSTGLNLRVNPADGSLTVDGTINPGTPTVTAVAYTNNFAGATTTVLFDIDSQTDRILRQDPPNNGTLVDVGPLGINIDSANGFDIGGTSGTAYGIFTVAGASKIYTVNLTSGAATAGPAFPQTVKGFTLGLGF